VGGHGRCSRGLVRARDGWCENELLGLSRLLVDVGRNRDVQVGPVSQLGDIYTNILCSKKIYTYLYLYLIIKELRFLVGPSGILPFYPPTEHHITGAATVRFVNFFLLSYVR
jgi:hypothetical protein